MSAENTFPQKPSVNVANAGDKASQAASQVKAAASNFSQTAVNKIDENRATAASGLDSAAAAIRDNANTLPGGEVVANFAKGAADSLSSTAEYVRNRDARGMGADVAKYVKTYPGRSIFAAVALGFLIGRMCSGNGAAA